MGGGRVSAAASGGGFSVPRESAETDRQLKFTTLICVNPIGGVKPHALALGRTVLSNPKDKVIPNARGEGFPAAWLIRWRNLNKG
jgi:hypothetical protein